jgi:hypothetical protein
VGRACPRWRDDGAASGTIADDTDVPHAPGGVTMDLRQARSPTTPTFACRSSCGSTDRMPHLARPNGPAAATRASSERARPARRSRACVAPSAHAIAPSNRLALRLRGGARRARARPSSAGPGSISLSSLGLSLQRPRYSAFSDIRSTEQALQRYLIARSGSAPIPIALTGAGNSGHESPSSLRWFVETNVESSRQGQRCGQCERALC